MPRSIFIGVHDKIIALTRGEAGKTGHGQHHRHKHKPEQTEIKAVEKVNEVKIMEPKVEHNPEHKPESENKSTAMVFEAIRHEKKIHHEEPKLEAVKVEKIHESVRLPTVKLDKTEPNKKHKIWRVIALAVSSFTIASLSAAFSVYGLSKLFAGAAMSVIAMGIGLEAGKFMAASVCHWYWTGMNKLLRFYLCLAVIVLMVINSLGIYGYLTSAYQKSTLDIEKYQTKIALLEERKNQYIEQKKMMDKAVESAPATYITGKIKLTRQFEPEQARINSELEKTYSNISELKGAMITTSSDVGPIIFISKTFSVSMDKLVGWLIGAFVAVFDPLAVSLVLALNYAIKREIDE